MGGQIARSTGHPASRFPCGVTPKEVALKEAVKISLNDCLRRGWGSLPKGAGVSPFLENLIINHSVGLNENQCYELPSFPQSIHIIILFDA